MVFVAKVVLIANSSMINYSRKLQYAREQKDIITQGVVNLINAEIIAYPRKKRLQHSS